MLCRLLFSLIRSNARTLLLAAGILTAGSVFAQQSPELPGRIARVVAGHELPPYSYSFEVREVGSNDSVLSVNAGQMMNPASAMKTVTTFSALEKLGPGFTWDTELYALGPVVDGVLEGDLVLRGGGDPFLVEENLRRMLKALQREGIRDIRGNLVLDGSYFDPSVEQAANIDTQAGRAYNTDPNAIIANFQAVTFYFYPNGNGRDVFIVTDPYLPNLQIDNRLTQVNRSCSGYQRGINFSVNPLDSTEVIFSGQFPSRCSRYQMVREVLTAPDYTFGLFQVLWLELGGTISGEMVRGTTPEDADRILLWNSSPLSEIIRSINKASNNVMTRHLLLTLAAEKEGLPATVENGINEINLFLESLGLDTSQLAISNGAGLSREARVTTRFLNDLLQQAWRSNYMPEFVASLPINGTDGTMRNRLRGLMTGAMHVKTGSLDEVSAVAGYVKARSGRWYTVTGIVNHELADRGPGSELLDALLYWVWER